MGDQAEEEETLEGYERERRRDVRAALQSLYREQPIGSQHRRPGERLPGYKSHRFHLTTLSSEKRTVSCM